MKKLFALLLTIALSATLVGCSTEDVVETKTCTKEAEGISQTYKLTATNGEIDKVELVMVYDNSIFGLDTLSTLTDDQKELIKTNMLTTLGLESNTYEGFEINVDIQDQMTVTVSADIEKADPEVLKKVGLDFDGVDMDLDNAVDGMTSDGAVCK